MLDDRKNVKIIDFGFSCCSDKNLKIFCGTPSYMAPEIVMKRDYSGPQADAWALGVVLYVFLTGHFPFKAPSDRELYRKISRGLFHLPSDLPHEAKKLIQKALIVDPTRRLKTSEVSLTLIRCYFTRGLIKAKKTQFTHAERD